MWWTNGGVYKFVPVPVPVPVPVRLLVLRLLTFGIANSFTFEKTRTQMMLVGINTKNDKWWTDDKWKKKVLTDRRSPDGHSMHTST